MEPQQAPDEQPSGAFEPPFTKADMLAELEDTLWGWLQAMRFGVDDDAAVRLLGHPDAAAVLAAADDFSGPVPDQFRPLVRGWSVVKILGDLYDYAMLGFDSTYEMDSESEYTHVSAFLLDLHKSHVQAEIDTFGTGRDCPMAIQVVHTALARQILEEDSELFLDPSVHGLSLRIDGRLTFRDMALLAKMEEKSVRNAANPKRPNALRTVSIDGAACIEPHDAREWLKARGRYLPIVPRHRRAQIDLSTHAFEDLDEALRYIEDRFRFLELTADEFGQATGERELREWTAPAMELHGPMIDPRFEFTPDVARDAERMARFARVLEVPVEIFVLRMREAAAREELGQARQALHALTTSRAS